MESKLTREQKYGIATMLATSSYSSVQQRIKQYPDASLVEAALAFASSIDPLYVRRDGFIPKTVIKRLA